MIEPLVTRPELTPFPFGQRGVQTVVDLAEAELLGDLQRAPSDEVIIRAHRYRTQEPGEKARREAWGDRAASDAAQEGGRRLGRKKRWNEAGYALELPIDQKRPGLGRMDLRNDPWHRKAGIDGDTAYH